MSRPVINVTPLIDVLLVLLIIFMCVAPLKPRTFHARVPAEQRNIDPEQPHPDTLVVCIDTARSLTLNNEMGLGTTEDTQALLDRLKAIFAQRVANGSITGSEESDSERPYSDKAERTVFIKAPKSLDYGSVAKVVDAVKLAGAYPISLQIDGLE